MDRSSWWALAVSLVAHASLAVATVALVVDHAPALAAAVPPGAGQLEVGSAGDTFDIDGLVDGVPGRGRPAEQARPAPATNDDESDRDGPSEGPIAPVPPPPSPPAPAPPPVAPAPAPEPPDGASTEPPVEPPALPPSPTALPAGSAAPAMPPGEGEPKTPAEAASGGASPSAAAGEEAAGDGSGAGRTYGAEGDGRGVRVLAPAFTRAIPAAVSADLTWSRLPVGSAGRVELTVTVGGDGAIARVAVADDASEPLRALVERTLALLRAGRFALSPAGGAGEQTLRIEVELSQRAPIEHDSAKPSDALKLGHQPPTATEPGKAFFTLASGRHFEARITVVRSAKGGSSGASG